VPGYFVAKESMFRPLRDLSGWLLLAALAASPLLYGTTAWWSEHRLAAMLGVAFIVWLLSRVTEPGFTPRISLLDFGLLYLLAVGWWMTLNARGLYDFEFRDFFHLSELVPWAPGSIDRLGSYSDMVRVTGLFAAFVVARSLGEDRVWRQRLLATVALTGLLIAIIGIILKLGGPSLMANFWIKQKISGTDFAFFEYHANAGAYLNLTWPIALGLGLSGQALGRCSPVLNKWLWLGAAAIILVAIQLNLSKGAIAVTLMLGILFALAWIRVVAAPSKRRQLGGLASFSLIVLILAGFLAQFSHYSTAWQRWEELSESKNREGSINYRLEIHQISFHMAQDAGWWGFGPGTFEAAFAPYQDAARKPPGRFDEAHEDYLQTIIEWGIGGALVWAGLVFGGLVKIWQRVRAAARQPPLTRPFWIWYAILLALLGVLLHAAFDFPLEIDSIRLYVLVFLALGWSREAEAPVRTQMKAGPVLFAQEASP
jgi:O-antigen ligase